MIDPITPAIEVSYRGKSYPLQLTLGALAGASGRLGVPILEGGPDSLSTKPELFQRAVILYALLHRKFKTVTIEECEDLVVKPSMISYYEAVVMDALKQIQPALDELAKSQLAKVQPAGPLAGTDSGENFGQSES